MDKLFWVIPGCLAGRPGPDDEPWNLSALRQAGIEAVLSVNAGQQCDPAEFASNQMAYACHPLSDWVPPQPGDAEICLDALPRGYDFVKTQLAQGTGLFLSYFLVRHAGLSASQAIQQVQHVRPTALGAEGWVEFAMQVLLCVEQA
jgi:hypothetical protein